MELVEFATELFSGMETAGVPYCIARNYVGLPARNPGHDIDIVVRRADLPSLQNLLLRMPGVQLTGFQERPYVVSYCVNGVRWGDQLSSIIIDFVVDLYWKGAPYLQVDEVLQRARQILSHGVCLRVPDEVDEAIMSFFGSFLVGGWIKGRYQQHVREVFAAQREIVIARLRPTIGGDLGCKLVDYVVQDERAQLLGLLRSVRRRVLLSGLRRRPASTLAAIARHYSAELRIRYTPASLTQVCILGPDGAGKTAVIAELQARLRCVSKSVCVQHLRPRILIKPKAHVGTPVTDPHSKSCRSTLVSMLKLVLWLAEEWAGQFCAGSKGLTLRLCDRYYHDLLVDPRRYRYGGPMWLARIVGKLMPKPHLWILLNAPVEVLRARKQEVSEQETRRQCEVYRHLIRGMENAVIVDAARPLSAVVVDAERHIVDLLARRTTQAMSAVSS